MSEDEAIEALARALAEFAYSGEITKDDLRRLFPKARSCFAALRPYLDAQFAAGVYAAKIDNEMANGALIAIRELLDAGGVPRGTFVDDQVKNLIAMFNDMKAQRDAAFTAGAEAMREADAALCESHRIKWLDNHCQAQAMGAGFCRREILESPIPARGDGDEA